MTRPAKLLAGLLGVIAIVGTLPVADNRAQPAERDHSTGRQIVDALSLGNVVASREQVFFDEKRLLRRRPGFRRTRSRRTG